MEKLFCDKCGNLLENVVHIDGTLKKVCSNDLETYDASVYDSLIDSDNMQSAESVEKFEKFITNSAFDPTNKKIINPCPKCKKKIVTMIQITDQLKTIYTCTCGNIWT
jgi:DNA-directed RNA polymerase subunit M/transcription elongation factor TFIIS